MSTTIDPEARNRITKEAHDWLNNQPLGSIARMNGASAREGYEQGASNENVMLTKKLAKLLINIDALEDQVLGLQQQLCENPKPIRKTKSATA